MSDMKINIISYIFGVYSVLYLYVDRRYDPVRVIAGQKISPVPYRCIYKRFYGIRITVNGSIHAGTGSFKLCHHPAVHIIKTNGASHASVYLRAHYHIQRFKRLPVALSDPGRYGKISALIYTDYLRRYRTASGTYGNQKILGTYLFYTLYLTYLIKISLIHIKIALGSLQKHFLKIDLCSRLLRNDYYISPHTSLKAFQTVCHSCHGKGSAAHKK